VPVSEFGAVTVVIGATPALPISYEPSGIPVRATPPAVSGAVDVAVAVVVVLPQGPEVPGTVGVPAVTAPIDVPIVVVVVVPIDVPAVVPIDPVVIPPPSKTQVEPEIGVVGRAIIEHGDELPVMPVLVPNAPESRGLTPGVESSVEPMGIPVGATVPVVVPSGEVAPMLSIVVVAICAKAIFEQNTGIVSASNARRMSHLLQKAGSSRAARSGLNCRWGR
jgi:hypothetical protein